MESIVDTVRNDNATGDGAAPTNGPQKGTDESVLFDDVETADEKVQKWRFLAKGTALADILAVMGAKAVEGEAQISFKVEALGNRELGEVFRALFAKAHAANLTLSDLLALVKAKSVGVDVKTTLKALTDQTTRKPDQK